ncbi:hypothetical protein UPYG_G00212390 [Umbra pygmaea]|uniref:Centromere protein F-like n=1 Tax=Umbra pygmaea TaxID=75934 RepID=A0ABD0WK11_UMBPY
MSWAEDDWTLGLPSRALQKVRELQVQQERLNRERQQKQLQLDSTQTSLHKQTVKYEQVRGELQSAQRDMQVAREEVQAGISARERLSQELQVKQAQVCSLEGQLASTRTLTHNLEKQVKRLEAELEKLQNFSSSGDSMLFSTPGWNMTSPWDHNGSRQEGREGDHGPLQARQQLKFSDPGGSPVFPRQQPKGTPHRPHQSDCSSPSAVFPWERDDPMPFSRGRSTHSPFLPSSSDDIRRGQDAGDCGMAEVLQRGPDMSGRVAELQGRVRALEGELEAECERFRQTQDALATARKDLTTREQSLQKTKDQLSLAHTRISQESDRAQALEQRLKQLQEELKCQRQNSESSRLQHQQRFKDLEKQHQRDVLELQKEHQSLEKHHQQDINKLNQEIQQARTLYNTLQSQSEKVALQKQALQKDVEALKDKLTWTDGQLKESQKTATQTQTKLTESIRENEGLGVFLEQSRRKEKGLEEEVKRLAEELAEALQRIKQLEDQKTAQLSAAPLTMVQVSPAGQSFSPVSPLRHDRSTPHTPTTPPRRPAKVERAKEEGEERGVMGRRANYPSEREPGEGIDSEHITAFESTDSEKPTRRGDQGWCEERKPNQEGRDKEESVVDKEESVVDGCVSGKEVSKRDNNTLNTRGSVSPTDRIPNICSSASSDTDYESETLSGHSKPSKPRAKNSRAAEDLQAENRELRSELQDVKEELQRRLEDLESQRRAEAEARTKLKQLSRKRASQGEASREREREGEERRRELEEERAETGRLKHALADLELNMKRERERREGEGEREREDRESESVLLNLQLKKQLAELKTELLIEREEREREKEELKSKGNHGKNDLVVRMEELQAELEELKNRGRYEGNNLEKNSPLTYLTLDSDEHILCATTNLQNTAVSQARDTTANVIQEDGTLRQTSELSRPLSKGKSTDISASDLGETIVEPEKQVFPSNQGKNTGDNITGGVEETAIELQVWGLSTSELAQEVERLRGESASEAGRTRQTQAKLEALQSQVTRQTQQLTLAFDHQSRHIQDLLVELQGKEDAILRQGQELQRCRNELAVLREEKLKEDRGRGESRRVEEKERREEVEEDRGEGGANVCPQQADTVCPQQADTMPTDCQLTPSPLGEPVSGMVQRTNIIMKPPNTPPASSALNDASGQENCVTGQRYVTDSAPLASHSVGDVTVEMEVYGGSALSDTEEEAVEVTENFIVDHSTVARSNEHKEQVESSELQPIILGGETTTDSAAFRRVSEQLLLTQRDMRLARAENQHLTAKLEKASGVTDQPETPSLLEKSWSDELQSLKQENQQLQRKLQTLASLTVPEKETSSARNTPLPASCQDMKVQTEEEVGKRKNQDVVKEARSTCPQPDQIRAVNDVVGPRRGGILRDAGKPSDEGEVRSEETEPEPGNQTVLDTTLLTPLQVTCLETLVGALQAELQSLCVENQKQAEELAVWRLTTQVPCLDTEEPEDPGGPVVNTGGYNTVTVIKEDELLLSCTSNRLCGRTLASRIQHCNSPDTNSPQNSPRKVLQHNLNREDGLKCQQTKATHYQETEKQTKMIQWAAADDDGDDIGFQHNSKEDRSDDRDAICNALTPTSNQNTATQQAAQNEETKLIIPRATDETKTKDSDWRCNLDTIDVDDLGEVPLVTAVEAESSEALSSEKNKNTDNNEGDPLGSETKDGDHSLLHRKTTTVITTEWQTETTRVENTVLSSKVTPAAGSDALRRASTVELRSTSTQTDEASGASTPHSAPTTLANAQHQHTQTQDEEPTDSPPMSPGRMTQAEGSRMLFSGSFPFPSDPARLAERIRRNRSQMSAAFDDTEYEPYGLPEVVMKGFADIPSGPACPYIVRRGLLGTAAMPLPQMDPSQGQEPD